MNNKKNNLEDKVPFGKVKSAKIPIWSCIHTDTQMLLCMLSCEKEWDGGGVGEQNAKRLHKMMLFYLCKIISSCIYR